MFSSSPFGGGGTGTNASGSASGPGYRVGLIGDSLQQQNDAGNANCSASQAL